jgi:hypothetical protein
MNFNSIKLILSVFSIGFLISCSLLSDSRWEPIDTDNEEKLNVFAVISLDDSLQSFVVVHKTLDTASPDQFVVGRDTIYYETWKSYNENTGLMETDTFWYETPIYRDITESMYLVKDATVTISDGSQDYIFTRAPQEKSHEELYYWSSNLFEDLAIYLNTDSTFHPRPNTEYSLTITTPNGLSLTGSTTTPHIPQLIESNLRDTLSMRQLFQISWHYHGDYSAAITTGIKNWGEDNGNVCGIYQYGTTDPGDTTWNSSIDSWCYENNPDPGDQTQLDIRLRFLDNNYYDYFLATDEGAKISNFLVGGGAVGAAYGVEGGYGVFGSLSAYWTQRIAIP